MFDSPRVLELAILGLISVVFWVGKQQMRRIDKLEQERQTIASAALDRAEIKSELKEIKDEMTRNNSRVFERLDTIMDRITFGNGR